MRHSLSDYSADYPHEYGYDSMEALYEACYGSYYKMMDKPDPTNTKDVWALDGKLFNGAKAFVRVAMPALKEEHSARCEAMIVSPYIARSVHRNPPSNWNMQIYWNSLGRRLISQFWDAYEDGRKAFLSQDGKIVLPKRHEGKLLSSVISFPTKPKPIPTPDNDYGGGDDDVGREKIAKRKERKNQGEFREKVLNAYGSKCCLTGIDDKRLLVASHIKPWSVSSDKEKLKVENGLLLNALHDHAFDRGLITISSEGEVEVSSEVSGSVRKILEGMLLDEVKLPEQVKENPEFWDFLEGHRKCVFRK